MGASSYRLAYRPRKNRLLFQISGEWNFERRAFENLESRLIEVLLSRLDSVCSICSTRWSIHCSTRLLEVFSRYFTQYSTQSSIQCSVLLEVLLGGLFGRIHQNPDEDVHLMNRDDEQYAH